MTKYHNFFNNQPDVKPDWYDDARYQLFGKFDTNDLHPETINDIYIQSERDPQRYRILNINVNTANKYKLSFPRNMEHLVNLASNERYIAHEIINGKSPLTAILATIGAGKSTLIRFMYHQLSIGFSEESDRKILQVLVDLRRMGNTKLMESHDFLDVSKILGDSIATEIRFAIVDQIVEFGDPDFEITEFWDLIFNEKITPRYLLDNRFKKIFLHLKQHKIDGWKDSENGNYRDANFIKHERRKLLETIEHDPIDKFQYVCELLAHIRRLIFKDCSYGIVIYIDNLDQFPPETQRVFRTSCFELLRLSKSRIIITMRVSTWHSLKTSNYTEFTGQIDHHGPMPIDVLNDRITKKRFLNTSFSHNQHLHNLAKDIKAVLELANVQLCLKQLGGFNIRKTIELAQPLLLVAKGFSTNHAPSPHIFRRSIISCGYPMGYDGFSDPPVDNLFQSANTSLPLIKPRLLHIANHAHQKHGPMELSDLLDILLMFGYSETDVRHALNDLMHSNKRIIWTDSVLFFESLEMLHAGKHSKIYAATVSKGYIDLLEELDYLREMSVDTEIADEFIILEESDTKKHLLWADILISMMEWMWNVDVRETLHLYQVDPSLEMYKKYLPYEKLLVSLFLPKCILRLRQVLKDRDDNKRIERLDNLSEKLSWDLNFIIKHTEISTQPLRKGTIKYVFHDE